MAEESEFVVDASFVLAYLLPDEKAGLTDEFFGRYANGEIKLVSCPLLPFEVLNGLRAAVLKKRLGAEVAEKLGQAFLALEIELEPIDFADCFTLALNKKLSVYDASYLLLGQEKKAK